LAVEDLDRYDMSPIPISTMGITKTNLKLIFLAIYNIISYSNGGSIQPNDCTDSLD
jgi:hypothetical protein